MSMLLIYYPVVGFEGAAVHCGGYKQYEHKRMERAWFKRTAVLAETDGSDAGVQEVRDS